MNNSDIEASFPPLYINSDQASSKAQYRYLLIVKCQLGLLLIGAVLASFKIFTLVAPVAIVVSIIISFILKATGYDKIWYGGRAIAESVKTRTWRYMTGAEPYLISSDPQEIKNLFLNDIRLILDEKKALAYTLTESNVESSSISDLMNERRKSSLDERKSFYRHNRLEKQITWYTSKSKNNKKFTEVFFWLFITAQFIAFICSLLFMRENTIITNPTSLFTCLASTLIAWTHTKKYQELSQAYAITAYELSIIKEKMDNIKDEHDFSLFVADAENAISREHTLWVARRDY